MKTIQARHKSSGSKVLSVDDDFLEGSDDGQQDTDGSASEDLIEGDEDTGSDNESFASVDDLDAEGEVHLMELSNLAEKDPEFYRYLQENDRELLDFDISGVPEVDVDADMSDEEGDTMEVETPVLTKATIRNWQKALLEQRSLRALRKLLIAFRSAVHMNEDGQVLAWKIENSAVYNKLITTALRYTPVLLEHHIPYKNLPNGKFKPPIQSHKQKTLQKLILSYFHNAIYLLGQLTDGEILQLCISETAKIIPYVISSRKTIKLYLKKCLDLWSSAEHDIRIAAFLAIRKLASAIDESILDMVLKGTYLALIRSSKSTTPHTLPSINLMKNSASEIFCMDHSISYQHAFGYIRQLAVHLRNSMKARTKESYKQVYNWQYVHSIDFWSLVLARACDSESVMKSAATGNELKALIYPLVQVSLGALKLISNARSYPFHLQIIRSLLHLIRHTRTYIPLPPHIIPIITSTLTQSNRPKSSTLRPLDFEVHIRTPQQYLKTRVYTEGLVEEAAHLLVEWLATKTVQGSIAFPEIVVPLVVSLKKALKNAKASSKSTSPKDTALIKGLLERIEESAKWVAQKRISMVFAPDHTKEVDEWEADIQVEESPLGKYLKVQRKTREKRRKLVEKAREGEDEILSE